MGTLPATRSQQGCWEIGAGAGSQMGTAGSQNSGGSQQGCWEPTGNNLEERKSSGSQQGCWEPTGRREIWPAAGANIFTNFYVKANLFLQNITLLIWPAADAICVCVF